MKKAAFGKILFRTALVLAFLWIANQVGKFLYEPISDNIILTEAELKDRQGTIETLALGSSLMHYGVDTRILNEELDTVAFNLGCPAQPLSGTYYILEDELKRNPVERVFVSLSVSTLVYPMEGSTTAKVRVMKMLLSPLEKAKFVFEDANADDLETLLFCPARTKNTVSLSKTKKRVIYKLSEDFANRISSSSASNTYYGYGFEGRSDVYDGETSKPEKRNIWSRKRVKDENLEWLEKIAQLCEKNDVELNLVLFPHAQNYAEQQGDLADMDDYVEELAEDLGANLFDYNYTARPDIYDYLSDSAFGDKKHLNETGATIFTNLLVEDYLEACGD